jgi:hypothetical protein
MAKQYAYFSFLFVARMTGNTGMVMKTPTVLAAAAALIVGDAGQAASWSPRLLQRFSDMQADLDRERKTMMRLWAKREEQIRGVVESTAGMYGDLQGIAGRSLLEIDGLELPLLDGPTAADAAE